MVLAMVAPAIGWAVPAQAASPPNIVVVVADDLGFADVGYHGGPVETPTIDALAQAGVRLERHYAYPICGPTRVALMTSRNPVRLGLTGNINEGEDGVPLDESMFPESFRAAGYQTWALGKWHLGGTTSEDYLPQNRGFDHFYGFLGGSINESTHESPGSGGLDWQRNGVDVVEDGLATDLLTDEAVALVEGRDTGSPFLLYLAYHAVHTPYDAPQELVDKYTALGLTGDQLDYAAMAENMDANIARLLAVLDSEGIAEDTIVLFLSDTGGDESKGATNDPLRGGKNSVWEGGVRVPAVLRWPGVIAAGTVSTQAVNVMDWAPTLAAAAGVVTTNSKPLDGRDRWQAIVGGADGRPEGLVIRRGQGRLVLDGDYKLLRESNAAPWQLYDVYSDPQESVDLAATLPAVVTTLAAYDALIDTDADGDFVADDVDPCSMLAVRAQPSGTIEQSPARLRLSARSLDRGAGAHKLIAKGYFNPAVTTPAIDPATNGVHIVLRDADALLWEASFPGGLVGSSACDPGDGWSLQAASSGNRWRYVNKSGGLPDGSGGCLDGAAAGVAKVQLSDRTSGSKAAWQFKVTVKDATFSAVPSAPMEQIVFDLSLAAEPAPDVASEQALAGQCLEFAIGGAPLPDRAPKPFCKVSENASLVTDFRCTGS
jgi:arylsulfatase A-like enzyme